MQLTILGGIDGALCDLTARRDGLTLSAWLGGGLQSSRRVQCYANINRAIMARTPDAFARVAEAAAAAGFAAIKCAPFDFLVGARRLTAGLELAAAVRDAVDPDIELMVDLHNHLSVPEILAIGEDLHALNLRWLEDVAALSDVRAHQTVRAELGIPLAAGEFAASGDDLRPLLDSGVLDVVMPDVKHSGGLRPAHQLVVLAEEYGVEASPHNPTGPVGSAFSAALCVAASSRPILEFAFGEDKMRAAMIVPAERCEGGLYATELSDGIGFRLADRDGTMAWRVVS